jgi:hypothetical protein
MTILRQCLQTFFAYNKVASEHLVQANRDHFENAEMSATHESMLRCIGDKTQQSELLHTLLYAANHVTGGHTGKKAQGMGQVIGCLLVPRNKVYLHLGAGVYNIHLNESQWLDNVAEIEELKGLSGGRAVEQPMHNIISLD